MPRRRMQRPPPRWPRSPRPRPCRRLGPPACPAQAPETAPGPAARSLAPGFCQSSSVGRRRVQRSGYVKRILDRQPHIRRTELGHHRSVHKFHHRMHDRLRVHHHVDSSGGKSNSQRASMISRALFIIVAESIVILRPHLPRRMGQRLRDRRRAASCARRMVAKGPAAGRQDDSLDILAAPACRAWKMALCSLSTGRVRRLDPAANTDHQRARPTSVSLLARATRLPASTAAQVLPSPHCPRWPRRACRPSGSAADPSPRPRRPPLARVSGGNCELTS